MHQTITDRERPVLFDNYLNHEVKSLPYHKMLDWSKLKGFCRQHIKIIKMMISIFDRVENTVGKRENAAFQYFFFSFSVFQSLPL